jgi:glycosyltransferase involved in cell wall biosynthesis
MKRIAIISTSYYPNIWNSQGRSTFSTAYGLARKGYDVSVFTFTPKSATFKQQDGQVTVYYVGGVTNQDVTTLPFTDIGIWNERMLPLLLCAHFDFLILNNWHGWEAAKRYKQFFDTKILGFVPFLYSFTGWLKPLGFGLEQDIKNREIEFISEVDTLVSHTEKFGKKLSTYINREVFVIPNCHLDLSDASPQEEKIVDGQLCFVGRVNREKSLERIIRVLPDVPAATLVVASPESSQGYFSSLQRLAKSLDVEHRITFAGWLSTKHVRELYRTSALAIVPSQFEPYGYSALDPMALGTPVAVSEWSCLEEYLDSKDMVFSSLDDLQDKISSAIGVPTNKLLAGAAHNKLRTSTALSEASITDMLDTLL